MKMKQKLKTKTIRLNNSRIVWSSQAETDGQTTKNYVTFCYKLPANAQGVCVVEDDSLSNPLVFWCEPEDTKLSFLTSMGSRCFIQRRFYNGEQVGCQLLIRDYPINSGRKPAFVVEYTY
jgi:hypothetical protein